MKIADAAGPSGANRPGLIEAILASLIWSLTKQPSGANRPGLIEAKQKLLRALQRWQGHPGPTAPASLKRLLVWGDDRGVDGRHPGPTAPASLKPTGTTSCGIFAPAIRGQLPRPH